MAPHSYPNQAFNSYSSPSWTSSGTPSYSPLHHERPSQMNRDRRFTYSYSSAGVLTQSSGMHQGTHFVPTQAFDCDAYMVPRHAEIHHLREDPPVPSGYYARAPMTIPSPETEETRSASAWGENLPTFDQPQDFVASDPYLTHNTQTLLDSPETPRTSTWFQQGPSRNITQMPSGKITAAAPKSASRFPPRPSSEEVIIPGSTDYLSLQSQMGQRVKRSGIETASRRRLQAMEAAHEKVAQSIQRSPAFRDVVPPIKSNGKANALRYNLYLIRLLCLTYPTLRAISQTINSMTTCASDVEKLRLLSDVHARLNIWEGNLHRAYCGDEETYGVVVAEMLTSLGLLHSVH